MLLPVLLPLLLPTPQAETPDLAVRVEEAIDEGIEALLVRQNRDGSWRPGGFSTEPHWNHEYSLTAFALYTLLKCDLPKDHPSIQRGFTYLLQGWPDRTYAIGTQLMAFGALGDAAHLPRVETLVEELIDIRGRRVTAWPYPNQAGGIRCLSNTQYAVLGLNAAQELGAELPRGFWEEVVEIVLDHQAGPKRGPGGQQAGFQYDANHAVSASMTAAGLSMLSLAEKASGGLSRSWTSRIEKARELGLRWLGQHWSVSDNPGGPLGWHYYYLYGLERLGSLQGLIDIDGHDWYREGAEVLLEAQRDDGSWSTQGESGWPPMPMTPANTCFALLFLSRASRAPLTGEDAGRGLFIAEAADDQVWLRAYGEATITAYVSGFGKGVIAGLRDPSGEVDGLRIQRVEYWGDGELVRALSSNPKKAWAGERFAMRHDFEGKGEHTLQVRVFALGADGEEVALQSATWTLEVKDVLEPWMLDYASAAGRNLFLTTEREATTSSVLGGRWRGLDAADGTHMTAWIAQAGDEEPTWVLELKRSVKGQTLALGQVDANPEALGSHPRVVRASVRVNRTKPIEVTFESDPLRKTFLELKKPTKLRRLEITLLEWTGGPAGQPPGLAEVEFFE